MKTLRRWQCWCAIGLGLSLAALTGCQANVAGMTLPSGHYLQHPPQFIPESPPFPLPRELASMEGIAGGAAPAPGPQALPAPVPAPPLPQPGLPGQ